MRLTMWKARTLIVSFIQTFVSLAITAQCAQFNVTIDDQVGDPTNGAKIVYTPGASWNTGQNCSTCLLKPPQADAFDGTWMDSTYWNTSDSHPQAGQIVQASIGFTGIAVYVKCILIATNTTPYGISDMTFVIDGNTLGSFENVPTSDNVTTFTANQTVFSTTNLSNTQHTLQIQSGHKNQQAVVLLDTIVYTVDNDEEASSTSTTTSEVLPTPSLGLSGTSKSHNKTGIIVGAVLAAFSGLGIVGVSICCFRRRRQRQQEQPSWETEVNPLVITGVTVPPSTAIEARVASKSMLSNNMHSSPTLQSSSGSSIRSSSYYTRTDELEPWSTLPAYSQVFS